MPIVEVAQNWWKKKRRSDKIRNKWNSVYASKKDINLHKKESLFSLLFDLKPTASQAEIDAIIDSFVIKILKIIILFCLSRFCNNYLKLAFEKKFRS
jgi:hypothetical protein